MAVANPSIRRFAVLANAILRAGDSDRARMNAAIELASEVERLEGCLAGFAKEGRPPREFLALLRGAFEGFGLCAPEVWTAIMKGVDELMAAAPKLSGFPKDEAGLVAAGNERAAIYVHLRSRAKAMPHGGVETDAAADALNKVADEINRGEHHK